VDVERLRQENGGEGTNDTQRSHHDQGKNPRVDRQMNDVGKGEETNAGDEGGDAHRLRSQHGGQQLAHEDVEDGERRSDAEFADHRQAHGNPDRVCYENRSCT